MSTYTPIASQTLTANTASVVFAGIPQFYTDLIFIVNAGATSNEDLGMRFNNDSSAVYANNVFAGNGTTIGAGTENNATSLACTSNAYIRTTVNNIVKIAIGNYTSALDYKAIQITAGLGASGGGAQEIIGGSYRKTNSINQISFFGKNSGHSFLAGSTFNLYGIVSGGGYANGGDIVSTDGTYWYHTFLSSGAFTPTQNLSNVDYLVVAGGGGGGAESGGGGGAGGLRSTVTATGGGGSLESKLSLTANTTYTVVVGAGGAGAAQYFASGFAGNASQFSTIVSKKGGGGGSNSVNPAGDYGSAGGAGASTGAGTVVANGTATANQGYAGGNGQGTGGYPNRSGGGGGGAGSVGSNATATVGGNGGTAVTVAITGSSVVYAGGGGGGGSTNASGGGGGAGTGGAGGQAGTNATAYTGSGGGGGGYQSPQGSGGNGGSGIVIVRYAV